MDFFATFLLVIAITLLAFAFRREKLANVEAYNKAVNLFITAVVVRYPVIDLFSCIPVPVLNIALILFAKIIGYICILLSFRWLCLSWGAPLPTNEQAGPMSRGL
jgi:hypothetical protein